MPRSLMIRGLPILTLRSTKQSRKERKRSKTLQVTSFTRNRMNNKGESKVRALCWNQSMINRTLASQLLCMGISLCVMPPAWAKQKTISQDGVSLIYDTAMFSKVEIVEVKKQPLPDPHD